MESVPEWVVQAGRFVATADREFLRRATSCCGDRAISQLLRTPAAAGTAVADLMQFKPLADQLCAAGRKAEGGMVEILGLHGVARLAASPEKHGRENAKLGAQVCNVAAAISHVHGFRECEALFARILGQYAHANGNYCEAQALLARAEQLYEEVDANEAGLFRAQLAITLNSLGNVLADMSRIDEAKKALHASAAIFRQLSEGQAEYRSQLAQTLNNLSTVLGGERDFAGARECLHEAVDIQRALVTGNSAEHLDDLAAALCNLGRVLTEQDDCIHAFRVLKESLEIRRELARSDPQVYGPMVGHTLINLTKLLGPLMSPISGVSLADNRPLCKETMAYAREAVRLFEELTKESTQVWGPYLAKASINLGNALIESGMLAEGQQAQEAAALISEGLMKDGSGAWVDTATAALSNLALSLDMAGKTREGATMSRLAIKTAEGGSHNRAVFLTKGLAAYAYRRELQAATMENDAEGVFRFLAALREGHVRAGVKPADIALNASVEQLRVACQRCGREIRIVIAESLLDDSTLLAVLLPYGRSPFTYERTRRFSVVAESVARSVVKPLTTSSDPAGVASIAAYEQLGRDLWDSLPEFVRETLDPAGRHDVLISGSAYWSAFPWELLCCLQVEEAFLGLYRPLSRWGPLTKTGLQGLRQTVFGEGSLSSVVICPWDVPGFPPLDGARQEAEVVCQQLLEMGYTPVYGEGPLLGADANESSVGCALKIYPSVIHYTGHGDVRDNEEVLILHPADRQSAPYVVFGRRQLDALRPAGKRVARIFSNGPLVVLNACNLGKTRYFGGQREDLASAFLREGAEAVISTPMAIRDDVGADIGVGLYGSVNRRSEPDEMGHNFALARKLVARHLRASAVCLWPAWILLHYHGNPYARLAPSFSGRGNPG